VRGVVRDIRIGGLLSASIQLGAYAYNRVFTSCDSTIDKFGRETTEVVIQRGRALDKERDRDKSAQEKKVRGRGRRTSEETRKEKTRKTTGKSCDKTFKDTREPGFRYLHWGAAGERGLYTCVCTTRLSGSKIIRKGNGGVRFPGRAGALRGIPSQ